MGTTSGYITRNQDLIINMDAANSRSYTSGSTKCECLVSTVEGELENGTSFSPEYNGGWTFDGTNDYLNLGDRVNINPELDSFTCNVFFKIDPSSNDSNIIASKGNGSSGFIGWLIYYSNVNGALTVRCNGNNTISQRAAQHISINKGQNYMVTMVINRTDNTIKGYLNGSNVGWLDGNYSQAFTGNSISGFGSITNSDDFLIGERPQLNLPMIGTIYLFQTYNFALSEAQVYRNFRFFGGRYDLSVPPPPPTFFNDYSFEFDGTDDKVITSSAIVGSDITLSGWYNLNAASYTAWQYQFATCIAPSNSSASNAALGKFYKRGTQMEIAVQAYDQNSANYSTYAVRVQLEGAGWNHIVWTYNDTTKHIYCYLNGVAQTWTNYGGTITTPYLTGNALHLYGSNLIMGAISPTSTTGFFSGLLDEVSTYDRILTPSEITGIYNGGTPNDLTSLSPYGWWRNGDNSLYKDPQWLLPSNENKDKVSNYSMSLDGTDDYMVTSPFSTLDGATYLSMSFWVKLDSLSTTQMFIKTMEDVHSYQTLIYVTSTGMIEANIANNGANWTRSAVGAITVGNWHHVVVTLDNTINRYLKLKIFVDGTQSVGGSNFYNAVIGNGTDLYIGSTDTPSLFLDGNMDEVSIWGNHTLTPSEISTLYNNGTPTNLDDFSTPPQNWWRMGENATFKDPQWLLPSNENKDKISNYSMSFDGTDDAIQVGTLNTSLGINGAITISFWCRMPLGSTTVGPAPLGEDSTGGSTRNWGFICVYNSLIFQIWNADGTVKNCTSPANSQIQDNNWHHIVGTYDGTSNSGGIELFIDGSSVATATASSTGLRTSAQSMYIGAVGSSGNAFNWDGEINNVSVWDAVKTISDVSDGGLPIDLDGKSDLVGWWRMGDSETFSTNWTVPDQIGSNDGTSANMDIYDRVGESPGSSGNTVSYNMDIYDRVGDAPNSENNALSYNMVLSGRTTDVPT